MDKLIQMMLDFDATVKDRLMDLIVVDLEEIPILPELKAHWEAISQRAHLGTQYIYLSSFAQYLGLDDIELSIKRDGGLTPLLANNVELVSTGDDSSYYKLVQNPSRKELKLFSWYRFPILGLTKLETRKKAKQSGFDHILEETWFCHRPTPDEQPCGRCNPCKYAKKEGFARRIPNLPLKTRLHDFYRSWRLRVSMATRHRHLRLAPKTAE